MSRAQKLPARARAPAQPAGPDANEDEDDMPGGGDTLGGFDGDGSVDALGGAQSIIHSFYETLVANFMDNTRTRKPDPERLGLPNIAGFEEKSNWTPNHNWLFTMCRTSKLYHHACKGLVPYALSVERSYWKSMTAPMEPPITLEDVVTVIRAREGFTINSTTGEAAYHKVWPKTGTLRPADWKELISNLLRARYYYPYHDSRCRSDLHGMTNVCPAHAIDGQAPSNVSARADPNETDMLQAAVTTGHWNYGDRLFYPHYRPGTFQPDVDVPSAQFTFSPGRTEMTLHEATAYVAAGRQAVVLNDVMEALHKASTKLLARRDAHGMLIEEMQQAGKAMRLLRGRIPDRVENHAISIEKAKWVLHRYGPVEAWQISGSRIDLYGINPVNVQKTLNPSDADGTSFGGRQGGGGLRLSTTWAQPPGAVRDTNLNPKIKIVQDAFQLLDKYEADDEDDRYDSAAVEGGYAEELPLVLANLDMRAMEALQMSHINWKIGAWFLSGRTAAATAATVAGPRVLHSLRSAFEGNRNFNEYIGDWDVSSVQSMYATFKGAEMLNQSLRDWRVNGVVDWREVFEGCYEFNQTLETWVDRIFGGRMQAGPYHMTFREACQAAGGVGPTIGLIRMFDDMHFLAFATQRWFQNKGVWKSHSDAQKYLSDWGPPWWELEARRAQRV